MTDTVRFEGSGPIRSSQEAGIVMFHRHHQLYARVLLVIDTLAVFPALYAAYSFRSLVSYAPLEWSRWFNPVLLGFRDYLFYLLIFLPVWIFILQLTQRYRRLLQQPPVRQAGRIVQCMLSVGMLMGFLTYTLKLEVSRPLFFIFLGLTAGLLASNRILFQLLLRTGNSSEHSRFRILIVGTDETACRIQRFLSRSRKWGYEVVGNIGRRHSGKTHSAMNIIGSLEDLPRMLLNGLVVDEVIFTGSNRRELEDVEETIRLCEDLGIRTSLAVKFFSDGVARASVEYLEDLPLISFSRVPDSSIGLGVKRALDFVLATSLLVLFLPVMLVTAAAVKLTSPGPVFYRQIRCGLYGRRFALIKFRTMIDGAEDKLWEIRHLNEMDGPVFKMRNDPRVTPLGSFLRKFSIDELPQLWNVIKGEMSLVGPRAPLAEEVDNYSVKQRRRLSVKPGITCLWQVSGRNDVDFQNWMDLDFQYIDNWSLWLDFKIMARTIPAVFTGRGAR